MSERRGTKGLELWCRRMTEGYPGVEVNNMTTSWRDGLAFCAIIHHFRPDLIDFSKLNKDDIYYNNDLAFQVAERHLGIPALLEPEDMVEFPVPDRLSILTYLSQFYNAFVASQGSPSRIVPKRPANASDRGTPTSPASTSPTSKMSRPSGGISRRELCAKCNLPVFIAERLYVGKQLYHRTCFRCARCNSQLTLANYYETETENQFCCETCPDEEQIEKDNLNLSSASDKLVLSRSLSDEEKSAGLQKCCEKDDYSAMFESALEESSDKNLAKSYTLSHESSAEFVQARSRFMTTQLADSSEDDTSDDEIAPDLPKSEPPGEIKTEPFDASKYDESPDLPKSEPPTDLNFIQSSEDKSKNLSDNILSAQCESYDSGYPSNTYSLDSVVHSSVKISDFSDNNQPETANKQLDVHKIVTKEEIKFPKSKNIDNKEEGISLVKSRMRLFEDKSATDQTIKQHKNVIGKIESPNKVPSGMEHSSPVAGLYIEKFNIERLESDDSINSSVVDESNENNKSRIKLKEEPEDSIIVISDSSTDSPIIISDDTTDVVDTTCSIIETPDSSLNKSLPKNQEYPEDLNPFGDDDDDEQKKKITTDIRSIASTSLNPFDEDEDDSNENLDQSKTERNRDSSPKPAVRKKIKPRPSEFRLTGKGDTPEGLSNPMPKRISCNPFEDDDKDVKHSSRFHTMKLTPAPRISLNPFWSDGEEPSEEEETEKQRPIPLPRNSRSSIGTPEPKPRKSGLSVSGGKNNSMFGSNTSLSSAHSSIGPSGRKKKQAPKPPSSLVSEKQQEVAQSSVTSSPSASVQPSPKLTPKLRKYKKAPLPPSTTSTPITVRKEINPDISPIEDEEPKGSIKSTKLDTGEWESQKNIKDELNRHRQSQDITSPISLSENSASVSVPDKSTYGKWKRRKGPAPSRPIAERRHIKPLPTAEIKRELEFIEVQQRGLEKQGVRLEQIIREKCEGPTADADSSLGPEVEDLILQLFELVNERNELFRKQAELMYLRRQQRLEEEYADLEYQIRCLMLQPEANKTDSDKTREEELINRLVEVVEKRNEIVECLEMDRVREAEEDDSINNQLNLYATKREEDLSNSLNLKIVKQKKKKEKKFKLKSSKKVDVDKDIDESETSSTTSTVKSKKKKKFNIF